MATSGKGTGIVGYNVQAAVDAEHHLIVAHEVTNVGHDRTQLVPWGTAQDAMGCGEIIVLADRGYFNGDQVLACEGTGVAALHPQDADLRQRQAGQLHRAGLRLRRRGGPLHLPGWPDPDEGRRPVGSPGQHRPLPEPERVSELRPQAPLHARTR